MAIDQSSQSSLPGPEPHSVHVTTVSNPQRTCHLREKAHEVKLFVSLLQIVEAGRKLKAKMAWSQGFLVPFFFSLGIVFIPPLESSDVKYTENTINQKQGHKDKTVSPESVSMF